MVRFFGWLGALLVFPVLILAAPSTFTISTDVSGQDNQPPTTPVLLAVTPVAATQINISWSASIDNVLVSGYIVRRDGVTIATTTLTTYSDTGLSPLTLYEYDVQAFDPTGNFSTSSNSLSTTTLALPPAPAVATSTPSSQASASRSIVLKSLSVETTLSEAIFAWQTVRPSRYVLRWGRTDAYDGGYIESEVFLTNHQTLVSGLEPGTTYLYELIGISPGNIEVSLSRGEFTTQSGTGAVRVPNVERLQVVVSDKQVDIRYELPSGVDIKAVRIVRSHLNYPSSITSGAVVYEGLGTRVFDSEAFNNFSTQYYTVFVIALNGAISSGAVARVSLEKVPTGTTGEGLPPRAVPIVDNDISISPYGLSRENIEIRQTDQLFNWSADKLSLYSTEPFTLRIPYDALPPTLKSIIVTLLDPTNQRLSYTFLLRLNADRSAYEATIAPLRVIGVSRLQLEVFDFEQALVGRYQIPVDFRLPGRIEKPVVFPDAIVSSLDKIWPWLLSGFGLVFFWWLLVWRRRKREAD